MIGLGLMGLGIATNIVKKGFALTAMEHAGNQPLGDLIAAGAKTAATAQAVAQASDIVILVVNGSARSKPSSRATPVCWRACAKA